MDKEKKKAFLRGVGWFFLKSVASFSGGISLRQDYLLGKIIGITAYSILLHHRQVALESLSVAFPEKTREEKKKIARDFFIFMIQGGLELLHFFRNPSNLKGIRVENKEYLEEALKKQKGVILLTAHIGNFPLMALKLAEEGFAVNFVTRPMRDKKAGDYLHDLRTKAGVKTIYSYPKKACVSGIITSLRQKEIVIIQMDQNFGTGGVWVKFFGQLAATPVGPVVFALRTGAAVVPVYIYRENEGNHCIKFFPEEELILTQDKDETILLNAIKFTSLIENWIKHVPSQWGWIHRRWKSRPSEKVKNLKFKVQSME